MKKITTKVLTIVAACAAMVFASCAAPSTVNGGDDKNNGNGGSGDAVVVWSGEQVMAWENGPEVSHDKFDAAMKSLRVTFKDAGNEACFKVTVSDPWTEKIVKSADGGSVAEDNAVNGFIGTGTVTITFNDGIVAKILGDNGITGWGGLTFQGKGCTITKLEMIK